MRFIVFMGGLLLAVLPQLAAAQTIPPLPHPVRDSAFAVHQLFKKHRHAGEGALGTGVASIVGMLTSSARGEREMVGVNALVTVVATVVGCDKPCATAPTASNSLCGSTSRAGRCQLM